ncbi:MAG: peptidoglycan DD-metalloendopeptidase family protein [Magnetococcales bacterium]|nr:peptidoglycan DD-metalloendopeptidase family protein [Magnetococcales bacterium]
MKLLSRLTLLGGLLAPATLPAVSEIDNQEHATLERSRVQLNRTVRELVREQSALRAASGEAASLLDELEKLDRSLLEGERRQAELMQRQMEALRNLPEVEARVEAHRKKMAGQRRRLAQHLRLMYELGSQGPLKALLSGDNSATSRQGVHYYARYIQARNQEFLEFRLAAARLRNDLAKSRELAETLAALNADLTREQQQLHEERLQRARFLEKARSEEKFHQLKVEELIQAKNQLTDFLEKLSGYLDEEPVKTTEEKPVEEVAKKPVEEVAKKPVEAVAKKPVEAVREKSVTTARAESSIRSRRGQIQPPVSGEWEKRPPGIFFRTTAKTPIAAIHGGQVVYADWFRGYGLLVILKHDEHVYSLYGHNNKLLVAQGDPVKARDIIAESGDSGALDGVPGLYFEIRIQGRSVNPGDWLMDRG